MALFRKVAEVMSMDLAGIDFLCADVAQSWRTQPCAVLEVNSMPYLDMHQYPSEGEPEDVAKEVWDWVLARAGQK
jgi:cyanophycin synthetase